MPAYLIIGNIFSLLSAICIAISVAQKSKKKFMLCVSCLVICSFTFISCYKEVYFLCKPAAECNLLYHFMTWL